MAMCATTTTTSHKADTTPMRTRRFAMLFMTAMRVASIRSMSAARVSGSGRLRKHAHQQQHHHDHHEQHIPASTCPVEVASPPVRVFVADVCGHIVVHITTSSRTSHLPQSQCTPQNQQKHRYHHFHNSNISTCNRHRTHDDTTIL